MKNNIWNKDLLNWITSIVEDIEWNISSENISYIKDITKAMLYLFLSNIKLTDEKIKIDKIKYKKCINKYIEYLKNNNISWYTKKIKQFQDKIEMNNNIDFDNSFIDFDDNDTITYNDTTAKTEKTALELFNKLWEDEDLLSNCYLVKKEINEIITFNFKINEEYLQSIEYILQLLNKVFSFYLEFENIIIAINKFDTLIDKIQIYITNNQLNTENSTNLKIIIDSFLSNITSWIRNVIEDKTANNIHYLGQSLIFDIDIIEITINSFIQKQ